MSTLEYDYVISAINSVQNRCHNDESRQALSVLKETLFHTNNLNREKQRLLEVLNNLEKQFASDKTNVLAKIKNLELQWSTNVARLNN